MFGAVPPPVYFIVSGVSQYLGAALAVGLFVTAPSFAVAWARIAVAAVVLLAWRRPWRAWRRTDRPPPSRRDLLVVLAFGLALGAMNLVFYVSISRIHLGTAVSLEYLGPVVVAAVGSRGWVGRVAVVLALAGVVTIGGLGLDLSDPDQMSGALLALAAGVAWGAYVVLGRRVATQLSGIDALALAMTAAAVVYAPIAAPAALPLFAPAALPAIVGVALLSSVVPYVVDQVAFRRVSAAVFALLTSLLPATSLLVGLVVLGQVPTPAEIVGLVLVSIAVGLASRPEPMGVETLELGKAPDGRRRRGRSRRSR